MPSPVKAAADGARAPGAHTRAGRRGRRRGRGERRRRSGSSSRSASSCRRRCSTRCRTGSSTCTSRCCRAGAARRRSSGRSSPATPRPGCASCASRPASTPVRCTRASATPIGADETAGELRARLVRARHPPARRHAAGACPTLEPARADRASRRTRRSSPSRSSALDPSRPAGELARRIVRAGNPRPGAWIVVDGQRVKVWRAHADAGERRRSGRRRGRSVATDALTTADGRARPRRGAARGQARDGRATRGCAGCTATRGRRRPRRERPRVRRSARSCASRTVRTPTSSSPSRSARAGSSARDRALRDRPRLRHAARAAAPRRAARAGRATGRSPTLDPPVRAALRVGHVPAGARRRRARRGGRDGRRRRRARARGFVNAVLRRVADAGPPWPEPAELGRRGCSYPDWIVDELGRIAGSSATSSTRCSRPGNRPAALTLRPNPRRTDRRRGSRPSSRVDRGVAVERGGLVPECAGRARGGRPGGAPRRRRGPGDPAGPGAARRSSTSSTPRPGERVLDVAAAPGGKATAVAERVGDDRSRRRRRRRRRAGCAS